MGEIKEGVGCYWSRRKIIICSFQRNDLILQLKDHMPSTPSLCSHLSNFHPQFLFPAAARKRENGFIYVSQCYKNKDHHNLFADRFTLITDELRLTE